MDIFTQHRQNILKSLAPYMQNNMAQAIKLIQTAAELIKHEEGEDVETAYIWLIDDVLPSLRVHQRQKEQGE